MLKSVVVLTLCLLVVVGFANSWGRLLRWRAVSRIAPDAILRISRGVSVRATLHHQPPGFSGLDPQHLNRVSADLVLTGDRFLLASDHGVLADLLVEGPRGFTSARCTGPNRLVLEGEVPRGADEPGSFRFELVIEEAETWAEALVPFVRAAADGPRFAVRPPARV